MYKCMKLMVDSGSDVGLRWGCVKDSCYIYIDFDDGKVTTKVRWTEFLMRTKYRAYGISYV